MPDPQTQTFDCIVMGAGISGATAARNLQRQGLKVLLLEGSDRVGGRMYSVRDFVKMDGEPVPVEAGAEYVHIEEDDRYREFWDELKHHGFVLSRLHKCGVGMFRIPRNRMFFPRWARTRMLGEVMLNPDYWSIPKALEAIQNFDLNPNKDITAKKFVEKLDAKEDLDPKARDLLTYTLSAHTPGPPEELSIVGLRSDVIVDQLMEMKELRLEVDKKRPKHLCGFDRLPAEIAKEFKKSGGILVKSPKGKTSCRIVKVEKTGNGQVSVTTENGKTYKGRSAVCTFSAGMLNPIAGEGDAIFGALLTQRKRDALEVVRMGPITKFVVGFKERIWNDDDNQSAKFMSVLSNPRGKARTFFSNFPKEFNGPELLTGLLMNQDHQQIANMTDEQAVAHVFDALKAIYGRKKNWKMKDVMAGETVGGKFRPQFLRQDWGKDPFAKGGNSYLRFLPKAKRKVPVTMAREALKDPRQTLPLFWAGEATAPAYDKGYQPLAVHGAYISGVRAAEDVHAYLNDHGGSAAKFGTYYKKKYL